MLVQIVQEHFLQFLDSFAFWLIHYDDCGLENTEKVLYSSQGGPLGPA